MGNQSNRTIVWLDRLFCVFFNLLAFSVCWKIRCDVLPFQWMTPGMTHAESEIYVWAPNRAVDNLGEDSQT